jgi:hypothetical protein
VLKLAGKYNLLHNDRGVVRVPFLIKGKLIIPPELTRNEIEFAFRDADKTALFFKLPGAQLIRNPVIDRHKLKYTGEYIYYLMPSLEAEGLIERDIDKLTKGPYALSVDGILKYVRSVSALLAGEPGLLEQVRNIYRLTSEYPEALLDRCFADLSSNINVEYARQIIDRELALGDQPGREVLNGWVEVSECSSRAFVRAMPTRQLHITAGNTPEIPVVSALRAMLTKSAAVIKCPSSAVLTGSLLALAAVVAEPDHPLTQNLSLVYWQGGDENIEGRLFTPDAFDRIVVWGSPHTVASVQSRVFFTRIVYFNPRYGVSLIGREAFQGDLEAVATRAANDALINNQKACSASLVQYIEGTEEQANRYARLLRESLKSWDEAVPQFVLPSARGQVKALRRGRYAGATWFINTRDLEFSSGVVVINGEFDISDHPMCRLIVVRPVEKLEEALKYLHPGVSAASVFPEERRIALRDAMCARGVSSIFPLGESGRLYPGMPQDGMPVLSQLVDWKNG